MSNEFNNANLHQDAIAVVGMAGRFPGAKNIQQYWQNLCEGRETVSFFKPEELDPSIPSSLRDDPSYVRARGIIEDADKFDAAFFKVSPLKAKIMDPQQRLMLQLAWHALEDAAHPPSKFMGSIGVYAGANWNRYRRACVDTNPEAVLQFGEFNTALANESDFLATRISYKLNLKGPSVTINTACSTSLVAIAQACQALLNGDCDMALAGGISVSVPIHSGYLYQQGGMLSTDGHCRPFDEKGTGTTFGDGAGMVALRRAEDAIAEGDQIYAIIPGFATNNDGADKVSFTAPSVKGQADAITRALEWAELEPEDIGFIEAHGTATPLGDPIEVAALTKVFGSKTIGSTAPSSEALQTDQRSSVALGSVKSNIGHLVHASGVAGFIKAVLAVKEGQIPPTLFFDTPNPKLDLANTPFWVNTQLHTWPDSSSPRRAGVSSFGVGGTNAHVIVEQAPFEQAPTAEQGEPEEPSNQHTHLALISAKTEDALKEQVVELSNFLIENASLPATIHTLQSGRQHHNFRAAYAADSIAALKEKLNIETAAPPRQAKEGVGLSFLFTGQGAQRSKMAQSLYADNPAFKQVFDQAEAWLQTHKKFSLAQVLFSSDQENEDIYQTRYTQPALFVIEYGIAQYLIACGLKPHFLLGHSVGEFVAACIAGIMSFEDALAIVTHRGEAMQAMACGAMLSVFCSQAEIEALVDLGDSDAGRNSGTGIEIAAVNGPESIVLAGSAEHIDQLMTSLDASSIKYRKLHSAHAFHTSSMAPAAQSLRAKLTEYELKAPLIPVISTATGKLLSDEEATSHDYWAAQLRQPVLFHQALSSLADFGQQNLLEVGPGKGLCSLAQQHEHADKWQVIPCMARPCDEDEQAQLIHALGRAWCAGANLDFSALWPNDQRPKRSSLPGYAFAKERHWLDAKPHNSYKEQDTSAAPDTSTVPSANEQKAAPSVSIRQRLISALENTSGYTLKEANENTSFAELGFDSLLLTQVSAALKREFQVIVSFRSLMGECGSILELCDFVSEELDGDDAILNLTTLSQGNSESSSNQNETLNLIAEVRAGVRAELREAVTSEQSEKKHSARGPVAAVARLKSAQHSNTQLTGAQAKYLDELIRRYAELTHKSKQFAQNNRQRLADPRTVSGFNPEWKEMVYPIVTERSSGSKLWDIDGLEYIDITNGFGPILFGHSPSFITDAVKAQLDLGIETGPQSPLTADVTDLFCELTGNERVGYANTGSEAVLAALRLARTVTGNDIIVMFEGAYHGIFDEVVVRPGANGAALPAAPGIPPEHTKNMLILPYGTEESLAVIRAISDKLAGVLVETVQSRNPALQPVEFLRELRTITEDAECALIFDEVVTGFRVHPGGAQAYFDIRADLAVYGKVVAGGFPMGLIAGKAKYMDALDGGQWQFGDDSKPEVGVTFFAGTFVRHPLALAASKAVLQKIKASGLTLHTSLATRTHDLVTELQEFLTLVKSNITIGQFTSYFYIDTHEDEPYSALLFYLMREQGIHVWEHRPCFLTTAHSEEDIVKIRDAFIFAARELIQYGLIAGDVLAAIRYHQGSKKAATTPPIEGALLGKDEYGSVAWFITDPNRPGKYIQLHDPDDSNTAQDDSNTEEDALA